MSYIRAGHKLQYFEGTSTEYVFPHAGGYTEDYNSNYEDNASLAELLTTLVNIATEDKKYAWKIAGILERELGVKRRKKPLTTEERIENDEEKSQHLESC